MARLEEILTFDYDDVRLIPEHCVVSSRSEVSTTTTFGDRGFKLPVVPANMSTIVDLNVAQWLSRNGYFYVQHRFDPDQIKTATWLKENTDYVSMSVGVKEVDYHDVSNLKSIGLNPEYITIDIAHGDAISVLNMVEHIKDQLPDTFVIAGNVATPDAVSRLENAGADAVKVGVGPGCFIGSMIVETVNGPKNIEDIEVGDKVLTHTGNYQSVRHKFEFDHHKKIIEVNGIFCTPDHEFYVCDKADLAKINENNYQEYCYWTEAQFLNPATQKVVRIEDE